MAENNDIIENGTIISTQDHQFLVYGKIGRGSFANVFRVKCSLGCGDYGMKIKLKNTLENQSREVGFLNEIEENRNNLPYRNLIVQKQAHYLLTFPSGDARVCILFPLLGCDLQRCISHENFLFFHPHVLEKLLAQMLQAVDYLHKHGIIHTDLKPDNFVCETLLVWHSLHQQKAISISKPFNIKLVDLGSAEHLTGSNRGKISACAYRAPEVILERVFDTAADIWSLGCCFYALYKGDHLFFVDKVNVEFRQIQKYTNAIGHPPYFMLESRYESLKLKRLRERIQLGSEGGDLDYSREGKNGIVNHNLINFLRDLLRWDPRSRLTATEALAHNFFPAKFY